jgi:hypothetical protein
MKKIYSKLPFAFVFSGLMLIGGSCTKDLLEQNPTVDLGSGSFWKTEEDATYALMGAYSSVRGLFDRDYLFEGQGEFFVTRSRNTSTTSGNINLGGAYRGGDYYTEPAYGNGFNEMYKYLYGGVNHTNYVIENVKKMLPGASPASVTKLENIIGEARLLRGMVYFRLISLWGDVPYFTKIIENDSQVSGITRMPISQIKDSILADFSYAYEKLPQKATGIGRASKPAALAFRGKLLLYWACWNKNGWPELTTFTPNQAAATDFKAVVENYGLNLFRKGEPGEWGKMGSAEVLPNYFYMFIPSTGNPNADGEMIMVFTHGGTGTEQSEELMRDFSGRSHESSQLWVMPRFEICDRYQSTLTGDYCPPLIPMNPSTAGARTALNSAINPQSFENRDYRMKGSIMWDYEMSMGLSALKETGWCPFIYKTWASTVTIDGKAYVSYNITSSAATTGIVFRKFLRNYAGQGRSEGDYNWPVMRLADVYLMYAEASNEAYGPQADAIALVNKVRHRGNLPALSSAKTSSKEAFFSAIEQERIVELIGEGHRSFDLRRWRALERVFGPPNGNGILRQDTHGGNQEFCFRNATELGYQRCYIYQIPQTERERNPNLTQNKPWM